MARADAEETADSVRRLEAARRDPRPDRDDTRRDPRQRLRIDEALEEGAHRQIREMEKPV
jgi:hypothetical protein